MWVSMISWMAMASLLGQTPVPPGAQWERVLGERMAQDLDTRDGRIDDAAASEFLHRIEARLAAEQRFDIRLTRGLEPYARLLPNRVLYISGKLLERVKTEAELAGLIAHQLAHAQQADAFPRVFLGACVLSSPFAPTRWAEGMRDRERQAIGEAVVSSRKAGYDPSSLLDLLSRLAYENPAWNRGFVAEDLLVVRGTLEQETAPEAGYQISSSEFSRVQDRLAATLGRPASGVPSLVKRPR